MSTMDRFVLTVSLSAALAGPAAAQVAGWTNYGHDASHSGISDVGAAAFGGIRWQTPVDLNPQYSGTNLLIHYGSPLVTPGNTVILPVKTGASGGFQVEARAASDGHLLWTQPSNYVRPPLGSSVWTPSYGPTVAPGDRLYYPDAGGTVLTRANLDAAGADPNPTRRAFFGLAAYNASPALYNQNVFVNTPITADTAGNIYFGVQVTAGAIPGLQSSIVRIDPAGNATAIPVATAAGDATIRKVAQNCAPALSPDGTTVYVAVSTAGPTNGSGNGYLLALNSTTLATVGQVNLVDVRNPANRARLSESGTASPTVGPNGDVYYGVLENPFTNARGWMLHYNAGLTQTKTPASFGWDITPSIVPATAVPSYTGASPYLILTKYNNYAGVAGDGVNKLAILDPNATQIDPATGATVMKEILTIAGVTPDPEYLATHPNAVREWCINAAAVDPINGLVLANSEDGKLYSWDLATNSFTQVMTLTAGIGEAYTSTLIGPDGTVYAINNATLFAVGVPEPSTFALVAAGLGGLMAVRRRRTR